jgi:proteasome lid subunit RPN8/RPN11
MTHSLPAAVHRPSSPAQLQIPAVGLKQLFGAAASAWPSEICGLLRGYRDAQRNIVTGLYWFANRSTKSGRFRGDPIAVLRAELDARHRGEAILGVFHSHPGPDLRPSAVDLEIALAGYGPGHSWLLVAAPPATAPLARSWRPVVSPPGFFIERIQSRATEVPPDHSFAGAY